MTDQNQGTQTPRQAPRPAHEAPAPDEGQQALLETLGKALAVVKSGTAEGRQAEGDAPAGSTGTGAGQEDEIEVPWDQGVTRKVKLSDLVAKAKAAEEAQNRAKTLETAFKKNAAAEALAEALDKIPEEDREAVQQILLKPELARRALNGHAKPKPRDEVDETLDDEPDDAPEDARLAAVERSLQSVMNYLTGEQQARQQQSIGQQIEATMQTFPVFSENEEMAQFARRAIATQIAANPQAKIDDIVAETATMAHKILQQERRGQLPAPAVARSLNQIRNTNPDKPPSADDLLSGRLGKSLLKAWRGG